MSLHEQINLAALIREQLETMSVDDEALIRDTLEGQTDIFECMDWLLRKIADENLMQEAILNRMDALQTRRAAAGNREARWRALLQQAMEAVGEKTIRRPEATITLAPKPIGILSMDESLIPDEFFNVETVKKLDKKKLKEAAMNGGVTGVLLDNGGVSLRIRT